MKGFLEETTLRNDSVHYVEAKQTLRYTFFHFASTPIRPEFNSQQLSQLVTRHEVVTTVRKPFPTALNDS